MNCLIFCYFDNGGQGIALCDALNKYTDHTARCVTVHQTYLDYKTDVCLSDGDSMPDEAFDFFCVEWCAGSDTGDQWVTSKFLSRIVRMDELHEFFRSICYAFGLYSRRCEVNENAQP